MAADALSPAPLPRGPMLAHALLPDDPMARHRSIFLGVCLACIFSQYMLVAFLSPFFPDVAADLGLSSTMVGVIMAMDSLASCIFSPIVGFQTDRVGVRTMISLGLATSSASCCFIGFVPHICTDATAMSVMFIVARLIMGVGGAMVETAAYGTICAP
jgi:MFS family permease